MKKGLFYALSVVLLLVLVFCVNAVTPGTTYTNDMSLLITDLDFSKSSGSLDDDDIDETNPVNGGRIIVEPGTEFTLEVELLNRWIESLDIDIEDIEVIATLEDMADEDEQEEEDDENKIGASDDWKTDELEFEVPIETDEDEYELKIEVEYKDGYDGLRYSYYTIVEVKVEKDDHEVVIEKFNLQPATLICDSSRTITLDTKVVNIGGSDEDVQLVISNSDLGIEEIAFFELEDGDYGDDETEFARKYTFTISDSVKAGTYTIKGEAWYRNDKDSDIEYADLVIPDCEEEEEEIECRLNSDCDSGYKCVDSECVKEVEEPVITQPQEPTVPTGQVVAQPPATTTTVSEEKSFIESTWFIVLLVAVIVILLAVGIILLVALLK